MRRDFLSFSYESVITPQIESHDYHSTAPATKYGVRLPAWGDPNPVAISPSRAANFPKFPGMFPGKAIRQFPGKITGEPPVASCLRGNPLAACPGGFPGEFPVWEIWPNLALPGLLWGGGAGLGFFSPYSAHTTSSICCYMAEAV